MVLPRGAFTLTSAPPRIRAFGVHGHLLFRNDARLRRASYLIRQSAAASEGYLIRQHVVESLFVNRLGSELRAPWIAVNTQLTDGPTPAGASRLIGLPPWGAGKG